jgi:hypothetical protein
MPPTCNRTSLPLTLSHTLTNYGSDHTHTYRSRLHSCFFFFSCATCSLDHFACPGHFGHIELPCPVYNPMFFPQMYQMLRSSCQFCHQFRMSKSEVCLVQIANMEQARRPIETTLLTEGFFSSLHRPTASLPSCSC